MRVCDEEWEGKHDNVWNRFMNFNLFWSLLHPLAFSLYLLMLIKLISLQLENGKYFDLISSRERKRVGGERADWEKWFQGITKMGKHMQTKLTWTDFVKINENISENLLKKFLTITFVNLECWSKILELFKIINFFF